MTNRTARSRILITVLFVVGVLGATAPTAHAADRFVTEARAYATTDNAAVYAWDFDIARSYTSPQVDPLNVAEAYGRCVGCRALAVSFQVVIVTVQPATVAPENYAIAINEECTRCDVRAGAYQFVRGGAGRTLTERGYQELERVRAELRELVAARLTGDQLMPRVDALAGRVRSILDREVVQGQAPVAAEQRAAA